MGLFIIGVALTAISLGIALLWDSEDGFDGRGVICGFILLVGVLMIAAGVFRMAYKSALDGENPYHKEYVYRDMPDGTKVLTDSVYVIE